MLVATLPKLKNQSSIVGIQSGRGFEDIFQTGRIHPNATMLTNSNLFQNTSQTTKKGRKLKNKKWRIENTHLSGYCWHHDWVWWRRKEWTELFPSHHSRVCIINHEPNICIEKINYSITVANRKGTIRKGKISTSQKAS